MADSTEKTVIELFLLSELGRFPKPKERREIVLYLERSGEIENHREDVLAKQLGCSKNALKKDRQRAWQTLAKAISSEEAMTYMADYCRHIDNLIKEGYAGLKEAVKGGTGHPHYIRLIGELVESKVNKLQSVGVIPKELGRLTTLEEEWIAAASDEGVVSVKEKEKSAPEPEG